MKRNELLICTATYVNLKIIILGEQSQIKKGIFYMIPLFSSIVTEKRSVVAGESGGEEKRKVGAMGR